MRKAPATVRATKAVAILRLGLASALLAACAAAGPSNGAGTTQHPFETILFASHTGVTERRREVIRDEASWARLWAEIHAGFTPAPPLPPVDFSQHMLIAVALGTRPSGGFGIKVRSVTSRGESLEVAVLESCPAPGTMVTLSLTEPVEVVRAPRLAQTPTFRETRAASCR
jgi:hypothetical protein